MNFTISDLLEELEIETAPEWHHHRSTGWEQIDCPFCSPNSGRWRLGINGWGTCNCYVCGRLSLYETLKESAPTEENRLGSLLRRFRDSVGCYPSGTPDRASGGIPGALKGRKLTPPPGLGELLPPHRRYLEKRGFDPDKISGLWGVRGVGPGGGKYNWSLYVPVRFGGQVVSWTTRKISDRVRRRYNSCPAEWERLSTRRILYGGELAGHAVVVCEGPLDAWAVGPGGVATCGVGYSTAQMCLMAEYPVRVICFDSTSEGKAKAGRLAAELEVYDGETYTVTLSSGKDPSRAAGWELKRLRRFLL